MSRIRPEPGTKYVFENHVYVIRQLLLDGRFLVENLSLGGEQTLSEGELVRSLFGGRLKFVLPPAAHEAEGQDTLATSFEFGQLEDLPERYRKEVERRLRWIAPLLKDLPRLPGRAQVQQYRTALERGPTAEPLPSVSSLRRWVRAYAAAGSDVRALVPATYRSGGKGKLLEPEVSAAIDAVFAECRHNRKRRTAQDVYLKVVHRVSEQNKSRASASPLTLPSKETIYRRLRATDATQILRRSPGRVQAKAKGAVFPGPEVERILERVEIDDTLLDLFVVDEEDRMPIGRPTLAVAIDVFSAYPVGFYVGFEPPGYRSVMNCLLHSVLPKADTRQTFRTVNLWLAYGLPERLVMDHGPGYISSHLKLACHQLGIEPYHAPKRTPWFKGAIERFFRTHNTGLVHSLPGAALSDMLERRAHDSVKDACISLKEFERILHVYLLDYYAQAYHEGVRGIPAKKWEEAVQSGYRPYLPHSAQDVYMILLPSEERLLGRQGIRFQNLLYQSVELAELRSGLPSDKLKVRIKYDLADLGSVFVQNPLVPGAYTKVPCTEPEYASGLSAWKHRVICLRARKDRKTVDIPALARAKENIQNEVDSAYSRSRRIRTRKRAARLKEFGTQGASQAPQLAPLSHSAVAPPVQAASSTDASDMRAAEVPAAQLPGFGADFKLPRR